MWTQIFYKDCKLKGTHTSTQRRAYKLPHCNIRNCAQFVQLHRTQKFIDLQLKVDLVFTASRFNLIFQMPEAHTHRHTYNTYIHSYLGREKQAQSTQAKMFCQWNENAFHFVASTTTVRVILVVVIVVAAAAACNVVVMLLIYPKSLDLVVCFVHILI